jgi:hypothetical protein
VEEFDRAIYEDRKYTASGLHELHHTGMRGLARVTEQYLLTAVYQNIKKVALLLWKRSKKPEGGPFLRDLCPIFSIFFTNPAVFPLGLSITSLLCYTTYEPFPYTRFIYGRLIPQLT